MRALVLSLALLVALSGFGMAGSPGDFPGRPVAIDLRGRAAPPLDVAWVQGAPGSMTDLRGRVVLVRWWTDTCPFCAASAPALRDWYARYAHRGLVLLGVFHPKPPGDTSPAHARAAAARFEFEFPIAIDPAWKALGAWWLDANPGSWTSVTFLVDRRGVIRHVHPGGEYHRTAGGGSHWADHDACRREWGELDRLIDRLLDESSG